jgi:hypothetical protein
MTYIQELWGNMALLEVMATVLTIVAVWFISKPRYIGQVIMLAAQIFWLAHSLNKASLGLIIQSVVLLLFSIRALISWRKNKIA